MSYKLSQTDKLEFMNKLAFSLLDDPYLRAALLGAGGGAVAGPLLGYVRDPKGKRDPANRRRDMAIGAVAGGVLAPSAVALSRTIGPLTDSLLSDANKSALGIAADVPKSAVGKAVGYIPLSSMLLSGAAAGTVADRLAVYNEFVNLIKENEDIEIRPMTQGFAAESKDIDDRQRGIKEKTKKLKFDTPKPYAGNFLSGSQIATELTKQKAAAGLLDRIRGYTLVENTVDSLAKGVMEDWDKLRALAATGTKIEDVPPLDTIKSMIREKMGIPTKQIEASRVEKAITRLVNTDIGKRLNAYLKFNPAGLTNEQRQIRAALGLGRFIPRTRRGLIGAGAGLATIPLFKYIIGEA